MSSSGVTQRFPYMKLILYLFCSSVQQRGTNKLWLKIDDNIKDDTEKDTRHKVFVIQD